MRIGRLGTVGKEIPVVFTNETTATDVSHVIPDWSRETLAAGAINSVAALDLAALPRLVVANHRIAAPLARPGKIICVGLNYRKHAEETGANNPEEPILFMKSADCFIGPFDDIEIPPGSQHTDYEVELAIVIGERLKYATNEKEAMAAVAGYSISQDVSERHWQLEKGGTWDKGKSFPTFNPMGPWIDTGFSVYRRTPKSIQNFQATLPSTVLPPSRPTGLIETGADWEVPTYIAPTWRADIVALWCLLPSGV